MELLVIRNLSYHYPDGRLALNDISLTVRTGESVAIVGPNGAGKSTLLLHLNGVLPEQRRRHHHDLANGHSHAHPHHHGSVTVCGLEVAPANLPQVRQKVGLLFQDPDDQLFCATVIDDVAFGPLNMGQTGAQARTTAQASLACVGLSGYDERIPHHLSMGERKRVCLAGVLACAPEILALDEPTGNLDPRGRRQFIELIRSLHKTTIITSHDLEMVLELCDRVIILDGGRLHADGPPRQILSEESLLGAHGLEVPISLRKNPGAG